MRALSQTRDRATTLPHERELKFATRIDGRDAELTILGEVLAGLRAGRGRTVLIEGEAGIGKSALLAAALSNVTAEGRETQILRGTCDELTQRFPLSAMFQALGIAPTGSPAMPTAEIGALSVDPVMAALEQLVGLVHQLCTQDPVVLALEDLHWADEASLLCWRRLSRATAQMPLVLVGTRRPSSVWSAGSQLVHDVQRDGGLTMRLAGLAPEGVAAMTTGLVHGRPGRLLLRQLAGAAGNPFYIREVLDAAARLGALRMADGIVELDEQAGDAGGPTFTAASLQESIVGKLSFLSADTLDVLRVAALLGAEFSVSDLATVTERTALALMSVIEDAIAAGLLEYVGARLRFRHALLQQALYETMPAALRQALHRQVARSLIGTGAAVERIAQQLVLLTDTAESWEVDWLTVNAASLVGRVPAVAAELLERSLRRVPAVDARRGHLEDLLAYALFLLGRYQQVEQVTRATLESSTDPGRRGRATWLLGYALLRIRRYEQAVAALEAASARPGALPLWRARFSALRAMVLRGMRRRVEAEHAAATALAEGGELGDAIAMAYALHALSIQHMDDCDLTGTLRLIEQALPLTGEAPELTDLHMLLLVNQQAVTMELGRFDEAAALAQRTLSRNELSGSPRLGTLRMQAGLLAYEMGSWDQAVAELEAVTDVELNRRDELHALRALIAGHRDEWAEAARHLEELEKVTAAYGVNQPDSHHNSFVLAAWALESERAGKPRQGMSPQAMLLELGTGGYGQYRYKILPIVVRTALAAKDESTARAAAETSQQEAARSPLRRTEATARWCDGLLRGDPAALLAAARSFREMGLPLDAGNALEDAAILTAQAGAAAEARSLLDEALQVYTVLGARWDARRAGSRLRLLGVRPGVRGPRRRPATGWKSLTAMELQVAQLVAAGRSNPDIAAELFISRRTVEAHVSHILAKLQVNSRWEVKTPTTHSA